MKRTPVILLILIVILPLALLTWAGVRLSKHQQWQTEQQIRQLLTERLGDDDRTIAGSFAMLAAEMQQLTAIDDYDNELLRDVVRNDPRLFQLFVIDPEDLLIHPNPDGPLLQTERDFILRAAQIINDRQLQRIAEEEQDGANSSEVAEHSQRHNGGSKPNAPSHDEAPVTRHGRFVPAVTNELANVQNPRTVQESRTVALRKTGGWFAWYWGPGLNLIYWQRRRSGHIVGVALERSRWIADLIAGLPDTPSLAASEDSPSTPLRFRLVEAGDETIYEWGRFVPPETATPAGEIRLSEPLAAWQLQIFAPMAVLTRSAGSGAYFNLVAGLLIAGVALTVLALVFYQQYARDMQEAGQRVSFVNQVSHELRTPLTNIRMYAELAASGLANFSEPTDEPQRRIGVIVAESERLSRLIDNVLTFARQERNTLQLSPKRCVVDDVIRKVLSKFQAALDQQGIVTKLDLQAADESLVDPDALEQMLGNLIGNVEKYAAAGKWLRLTSRQQNGRTLITVADRGPGIAASHHGRVFEPFWRASDDLDQAAGTGIGLAIARHMARLHGGDLALQSTTEGATFQLELSTPPATEESK